ncbi:hypothetical protein GHT06_008420 [Daphnia sinensis]|uniref:Uncharacterized protein n=1 Tax=Daphnia sinensis TaxID=1820382 RepID=A0AAD5L192_9CRUS|nr:hypothetical protein GHT06_008420 [Daphnia sinensis]
MRVALFILFVFAAYGSIAAFRRPAYGLYPYVDEPSQQEVEAQARQLFWAIRNLLTVNLPRSTVRATMTSTVDMICTKSVARACRANQVPFLRSPASTDNSETIEAEEDGEEQFPVAPTTVQKVEATALPTKQARAADPQYFLNPRAYENQLRKIQSAFYSGPYDPLPMPFYDSYPQPVAGERQLFSGMLTATVTVSTALKINTVTKTPRCSRAGPLPQCPNA